MAEKTLNDAFYEMLKDVYYAEKQSVRTLKKSVKQAKSDELKQALSHHAEESANQVERLGQVFESIHKPARAKTCDAMQGITHEMDEDLEDFGGTAAGDDVLLACAQAIEHYEIARYGTLRSWAGKLGYDEAEKLLAETLEEEKKTDALLTEIAERLPSATHGEADEDEDEAEAKPTAKHRAKAKAGAAAHDDEDAEVDATEKTDPAATKKRAKAEA